jgi:hypothetical protein
VKPIPLWVSISAWTAVIAATILGAWIACLWSLFCGLLCVAVPWLALSALYEWRKEDL